MSGTDKLPLFIIGKAAKPRCFKNIKSLPTQYTSNKKAWMTSEIFIAWLKEVDAKMKKKDRKIAMIVDNCPAHPKVKSLENVELVFLPKNSTSKTQPMDQGVINNLKVHYRKRIVLKQISAIEKKQDFSVTVLDALRLLRDSWDCVTQQTIHNCFRHAGFSRTCAQPSQATASEDDEFDDIPLARLIAYNNRAMLTDFIQFDESVPTSAPVTEEEIVSDILASRKTEEYEDDNDGADEDDMGMIITPPTVDQAMDAFEILNNFYECWGNTDDELKVLMGLRRKMLRRKVAELGRKKQSSILDFMMTPRTSSD